MAVTRNFRLKSVTSRNIRTCAIRTTILTRIRFGQSQLGVANFHSGTSFSLTPRFSAVPQAQLSRSGCSDFLAGKTPKAVNSVSLAGALS
jgi:hypothetical protein